jgi:hypothetical protein
MNAFLVCVVRNYLNPATLLKDLISFLYVVICPCVEITSRIPKADVRYVSLLNDFVPFLTI